MSTKQDALQEILTLARLNNISTAEITRAMANKKEAAVQEGNSTISRLFGYIGGILVFAGICIFVGQNWDSFNGATQILVTLGTGFCAYLLSLATMGHVKFDRTSTPLMLIANLFQPTGIFVMLDVFSTGGNPKHGVLFMAGLMILQQGATFIAKKRTTLAFTTTFFGAVFLATLMDIYDVDHDLTALTIGFFLTCLAWAMSQSPHRAISAFWYFFGSVLMLVGFGDMVEGTVVEPAFLGMAAFFIFLSTRVRSRTLLLVGTVAMLCYIGYFTGQHFADSLSWPFVLILIGVAFIGLGAMALRINAKYIREKPPA